MGFALGMQFTPFYPIKKLGLPPKLQEALLLVGIKNTSQIANAPPKGIDADGVWELVQKLALLNIMPQWVSDYVPPIDIRTRTEVAKENNDLAERQSPQWRYLCGPYRPDENWMLIRSIASLNAGGISWAAVQVPGKCVEIWRSGGLDVEIEG